MGKSGTRNTNARLDRFLQPAQQATDPSSGPEQAANAPSDDADRAPGEPTEPSNKEILGAIQAAHASTTAQLDTITIDISLLRQDMQKLRERTTEVEQRVSRLEDTARPLPSDLARVQKQLAEMTDKADDIENRLRRNNVRLVGLPEGVEGRAPEKFMEDWLKSTFGPEPFSSLLAIERAHRIPTRPLPPGAPPRPLIMRFLNYRDRDATLAAARAKGGLTHNGSQLSFFPDYSIAIQKQRATFLGVKRRLRAAGVVYSMMFPAKLRIVADNSTHFFTTPVEADRWLDGRGNRRTPPRSPARAQDGDA